MSCISMYTFPAWKYVGIEKNDFAYYLLIYYRKKNTLSATSLGKDSLTAGSTKQTGKKSK